MTQDSGCIWRSFFRIRSLRVSPADMSLAAVLVAFAPHSDIMIGLPKACAVPYTDPPSRLA